MKKSKAENIRITIADENVFSEFAVDDKDVLDEMLVDTIEKTANTKPVTKKLDITFVTDQKIDTDKFALAYQNTMQNKLYAKNREIARCLLTGLVLTTVAICALLAYVFFFANQSLFLNKFGEIVSWVFVWASVEIITIEMIQLLIEKAKVKRLLNAKLTTKTKK